MHRPIFIVGCPRSGATLLRLMLRAHPRIAIPPETRLLLDAYEHRSAYGDLREPANRRALAEWIVAGAGTRFGGLGLDPRAVAEEIVAGPPTLGSALEITMRAYARRLGKPRWGDKRPGYVQHIDTVLRLFPHAQIVHVVRDGRDCVAALKGTPWWRMGVYHAIATWTQAMDAGTAAARRLPAPAYVEVRYERLLADPEAELRRLCAFLAEEYAPSMAGVLTHWRRWRAEAYTWADAPLEASEAGTPAGMPRRARETAGVLALREAPRAEAGTAAGVSSLDPWEASLCEAVMASRLLARGYEPRPVARPPARHLAHYAAVTAHRRLAARKRALLDLRHQAAELHPVASRLPADG